MDKEEIEKAKEKCKSIVKVNNDYLKGVEIQHINQKEIKSIETLLQYIQELEEIKEMKETIELAGMDIKSLLKFKYENERLKNKVNQLEQENNKQNKIIDEMLNLLGSLKLSKDIEGYEIMQKEDWKQYFEKKVEQK